MRNNPHPDLIPKEPLETPPVKDPSQHPVPEEEKPKKNPETQPSKKPIFAK